MRFKVGDKVRIVQNTCGHDYGNHILNGELVNVYIVSDPYIFSGFQNGWYLRWIHSGIRGSCYVVETDIELISNQNNMSIKESFALSLTPEPQKTFRKLGITNGDNLLTTDGSTIFLTWLLSQNQDKFKTEVCDDMLKEEEKNK